MKLKDILSPLSNYTVKGSEEIFITGMTADSKTVAPGYLFIAKKGLTHDGNKYISEAIEAGASAVMTNREELDNDTVTHIFHPFPEKIESALATLFYNRPADQLLTVGITGTNGKTTTSLILKFLLDQLYGPTGLIGTIKYLVGQHQLQATRTTPDVITNHRLLREMVTNNCQAVVMEVTSHALIQGRVDKIDYDMALFTNLTWDHLDYHQTMENYCQAKNLLFKNLNNTETNKSHTKWAIVNQDCPWMHKIVANCKAQIFTYGIEKPADLTAQIIALEAEKTTIILHYKEQSIQCSWPLTGKFNVYNCLAAISVLVVQGIALEKICTKISQVPSVRGRLEKVENCLGFKIYIDYAHTPDALENILKTLHEIKKGKLIVVFGCGGDRDKQKRAQMAEVCEKYADLSIVTSDNPRTENPESICKNIIEGFKKQTYLVELDRFLAIEKAIQSACSNDLILIAGKGHETYQVFAHQTIEFDDYQIALKICKKVASEKEKVCRP